MNKLQQVLDEIRSGAKLERVDLSNCGLEEVPREILLLEDSLELLNLGGNNIWKLPEDFNRLKRLRILFFAQNKFEVVPEVLGGMSSLFMVSFKSNQVVDVPENSLSPSISWLILTDNSIQGKQSL